MVDIHPKLIEKAAEGIRAENHEYRVDHTTWVPYCTCGWTGETAHDVADYTHHLASLALEAVADDIRAEAWAEGKRAALRQADWEFGVSARPFVATNPYRKGNLS